jgi:hypothetical protein
MKKIFYKGDYVIPSIIDFDTVNTNVSKYKWTITIDQRQQIRNY